MIRRLILVAGFFPAIVYFGLRWIVTGKSPIEGMDRFEEWADV